jgi:serine/threonine protein kinase/WD40 repeat protein/tetratricopeptide (TPR) repeat protein
MSVSSGTRDYGRFDELAEEFVARYRRGERPTLEEYVDRLPEMADEIREMFPALVQVEQAEEEARDDANRLSPGPISRRKELGDYRIVREVGRGGMGVVYEAEQISLGRRVALKVLPAHVVGDRKALERFHREAKAAARLHHTNIVPVFDVGNEGDTAFYAMQFIQGQGLDQVIAELARLRGLAGTSAGKDPSELVRAREPNELVETRSMGAAGPRNLVLDHVARSLLTGQLMSETLNSPANTAEAGAEPERRNTFGPDVTLGDGPGNSGQDFFESRPAADAPSSAVLPGGTAVSMMDSSGRRQPFFRSVALVGRQAAQGLAFAHSRGIIHRDIKPSNLLLDTAGVVWITDFGLAKAEEDNLTATGDILGTLRYMAPERFRGEGDARVDVYALGLTLFELLTLRPAYGASDRLKLIEQVKAEEPTTPRSIDRRIPRDLETIVLKAIEKEPKSRYQTAEAMAEDLRRFLADEPIKARQVSTSERYWRWARRNPVIATLGGVLTAVLLLTTLGSLIVARRMAVLAEDQRNAATAERSSRWEADQSRDAAKQARNVSARQAAGLLLDRGIDDARGGEPARALHLFVRALQALPPGDAEAAPLERTIRANLSAWAQTVPALEHIFPSGPGFDHIAYTPDGEAIAMAVGQDEVQCFRTDTGRPVGPLVKLAVGLGAAMEFAADGRSLWVASPGYARVVDQWTLHRLDPASGRPIQPPFPSAGPIQRLLVTPDGRYLVGQVYGLHPGDRGPAGDAVGTRLWRTASIIVWETASGRAVRKVEVNAESELATAQRAPDAYLSLSPDGKSVTSWVQRGKNRHEGITFTVDGNEPPIRVELPTTGPKARGVLHFENNMRTALAIKDGLLYRWSATKPGVFGPGIPTPFGFMHEDPSPDGRSVLSPEGRVFDIAAWPPRPTGVRFAHPEWQRDPESLLAQSPDGRFTTTWHWAAARGGRLWRLSHPHSRPALPHAEFARQPERAEDHLFALFDPRGTSAILWADQRAWLQGDRQADVSHDVRIVDAATGSVRGTSIRHSQMVREIVFTADGRYFASASFDATARVWETATGRPAGPPLPHTNYVATVAFSPDGNTLAAGDYGPAGLIKLWDWRAGKEVRPPLRHDDIILNVSFSPDGRYLAAIKAPDWSKNPELLVWEVASGTAVVRMRQHSPSYLLRETVRFRPDNRAITTRDVNGVLRLWEIPSGKLLGQRPLDGDGMTRFSPDGRVVAAAANLGVRLLDGDTLAPLPAGYLPHPDRINDVAFSPDGALLLTAHETGSAQLWDVATRKPIGPPAVLLGPIRAVTFTPDGKTCVCVAADGTIRRWPVPAPFAEPDLARLADRVALMTSQRMDDNQGLDSVRDEEWRSLRGNLVGDGSTALVPPRPDADWYDTVAADSEQDRDAFGAQWHLDRLAKVRPKDWTIPARRGRVLAVTGRRDEADVAYAVARRLAPSPQVLADWLRAAAADDEAAGRKEAALWNLDRAIALTPGDWTLYALRADLTDPPPAVADEDEAIRLGAEPTLIERAADRAAGAGNWKRSAALLTKMAHDPDLPMSTRYLQAVACLKAGDAAGYRAACAGMAERLPRGEPKMSHHESNSAARAATLGPNGTDDWTGTLAWTNRALARLAEIENARPALKELIRRERHRFLNTRGAVLYRAGRFEEAAKVLQEAMRLVPEGSEFCNGLFLALAEFRLGHLNAAKDAAGKARSMKAAARAGPLWDAAEVDLLAAELDTVMPQSK